MIREAYGTAPLAPLRRALAPNDADGAYRVQSINTEHWKRKGRRLIGHKIGLTSKAVQAQLDVDQPDFGVLFDDMKMTSGSVLPRNSVLQPKVEAEVAFILGKDLFFEDCDVATLADAVESVVAAIEVVDSRIRNWQITFADTVADNGSAAYFVMGDTIHSLDGIDLYTCGMVLTVNGSIASLGVGAACLGNPLHAAVWLARTLARRGESLKAGDIILTGALGPMVVLEPGDYVRAEIGGIGAVDFTFEA
ncbi:MAG: fumarylacetoacetate hydrolase family protein [Pseudomonadota bacterium]